MTAVSGTTRPFWWEGAVKLCVCAHMTTDSNVNAWTLCGVIIIEHLKVTVHNLRTHTPVLMSKQILVWSAAVVALGTR